MNGLTLKFICDKKFIFIADQNQQYFLDFQPLINASFANLSCNQICFEKQDGNEFDQIHLRNDQMLPSHDALNAKYVLVLSVIRLYGAFGTALPVKLCLLAFPSEIKNGISLGWIELTSVNLGKERYLSLTKSIKLYGRFFTESAASTASTASTAIEGRVYVAKTIVAHQHLRGKGKPNVQCDLFNVLRDFGAEQDLQAPIHTLSKIVKSKQKSTLAPANLHGNGIGSSMDKISGIVQVNKCTSTHNHGNNILNIALYILQCVCVLGSHL